jgi:histidine ammonia-lyase
MKKIVLTGDELTIAQIEQILQNPKLKVEIAQSAIIKVRRSIKFLEKNLPGKIVYGVNTGFGPMASHILADDQLISLQENLVRSHAVGMGSEIDLDFVLAAMVVRLNTLCKGYSGVSEELLDQLLFFINQRIVPVVYEHGAVGTSGDLVQLAHIALALMGEGEVYFEGKKRKTGSVLDVLKQPRYKLKPKEGLALINGTAVMTGIAALLVSRSERLLSIATINGTLALQLVRAYEDSISEVLHKLRPHNGQILIAKQIRKLMGRTKLLKPRSHLKANFKISDQVLKISEEVQDVYSFRCIPQILGPVYDTIERTKKIVEIEMNAVTDNPIIDSKNELFLHGGNFHGDYIAAAVDQLKIVLIKLTILSERRLNYFLNEKVNSHYFPPFLNLKKPGLTLSMQAMQFVATSTTAQSQSLAYPHYIHSIPTNADNQDVVSMGTDAALIADKVIENAYIVLAIETLALCQAVDIKKDRLKISPVLRGIYDEIRTKFSTIKDDRVIIDELKEVVLILKISNNFNQKWD